jgi:alpha-aminoadipate carrier protein LysW
MEKVGVADLALRPTRAARTRARSVARHADAALQNLSGSRYNPNSYLSVPPMTRSTPARQQVAGRGRPRGGHMASCPECDADIEVDEYDVDKGDLISCPECGTNLEVVGLSPVELDVPADADEEDDDEAGDDDEDEEEEDKEWDE